MAGFTLLEVPQWQGSGSPGAARLQDGCARLARLFPATERVRVDVPETAGVPSGGVAGHDVLVAVRQAVRRARAGARHRTVVTVGGDCAADLATVEAAIDAYGDGLALVWFDAHGDLNTPATSPSGAFHGMVLRALLGEGPAGLTPATPLRPSRVVLAGGRSFDPAERHYVAHSGLTHLDVDQVRRPESVADAVAATGATAVYVHLDLDVLDPEVFGAVGVPEPGGLTGEQLVAAVRALAARVPVVGLAVTEYEADGADPEVLPGLVEALAAVVTAPVGPT